MTSNLTNSYATVLFGIAKSRKVLDDYYANAQTLLDVLESNKQLQEFLNNTSIDKTKRKDMITDLLGEELDKDFIYFLWTVIDFSRPRYLDEILKMFLKLCQQHLGIRYIQITTAYPLSDNELERLEKALMSSYGLTKIMLKNIVDQSIIGGVKIKTNAVSMDDTIKNKIELMKNSIYRSNEDGG